MLTEAEILAHPEFTGNDNYKKPRIDYVRKVEAMDEAALLKEGESKIWLSAFAGNNPRSDYHWHVTALYLEMQRRDPTGAMYQKAYDTARATM